MLDSAVGVNGGALGTESRAPALAITAPSTSSSRVGGGAGAAGTAGAVTANVLWLPPNKLIAAAAPEGGAGKVAIVSVHGRAPAGQG